MEPIEPPWQAIKESIPDEEPDIAWFNHPRNPSNTDTVGFDQSTGWKPEEVQLDDGRANKSGNESRRVAESQKRLQLTAIRAKEWLFRDTQTSWRFSPADDIRIARMFSQLNEEESVEAAKAAISIIEDWSPEA